VTDNEVKQHEEVVNREGLRTIAIRSFKAIDNDNDLQTTANQTRISKIVVFILLLFPCFVPIIIAIDVMYSYQYSNSAFLFVYLVDGFVFTSCFYECYTSRHVCASLRSVF
jgi:hypothetical protein